MNVDSSKPFELAGIEGRLRQTKALLKGQLNAFVVDRERLCGCLNDTAEGSSFQRNCGATSGGK